MKSILTISNEHGLMLEVAESEEGALALLYAYCVDYWQDSTPDVPLPVSRDEVIKRYLRLLRLGQGERGTGIAAENAGRRPLSKSKKRGGFSLIEVKRVEFRIVTPFSGSRCFEELQVWTQLDVDGVPACIAMAFSDPYITERYVKAKDPARAVLQKILPDIDTGLKWSKAFDEAIERERSQA